MPYFPYKVKQCGCPVSLNLSIHSFRKAKNSGTFTLRIAVGQAYKQVLLLDDQLVKNGVKKLSFKTNSADQSVDLNLEADGAQFPVTVSMLNTVGKVMWTEQFTAPFRKQLSNKFKEPVALFRLMDLKTLVH